MSYDLQNFYKSTLLLDWSVGLGTFYVVTKPTVSTGWLVISPNNSTTREIVKYTSTGTDTNGDYVVVSVRGVGGTTEQTHTVGEPIRMNITAEYWNEMNTDIANIVAAGVPNANTTTMGGVEIATDAEVAAGTNTGSTGASLVTTPGQIGLAQIYGSFGNGSDGNVTISSPTTLTRDMYYDTLTVNSTLTTDGYRIFCKTGILGNGTIKWGIASNGGNATTYTPGTAAAQGGTGLLKNTAGKIGAAGSSSAYITGTNGLDGTSGKIGSAGGAGGNGGSSGLVATGGIAGANIQQSLPNIEKWSVFSFNDFGNSFRNICGSGSGASGGSNITGGSGNTTGAGGASGASGGTIWIATKSWGGTFTLQSTGGNGGNGGNSNDSGGHAIGGGGGGAGGNGGISMIIYSSKTWSGSYSLAGGAGGTGGTGSGGGGTGVTGSTGATGTSYEILISSLL